MIYVDTTPDDPEDALLYCWHVVYLNRAERDRLLLSSNECCQGWRRDGSEWKRANPGLYLKKEVDEWVRANAGHGAGEIWECDRFYYPDEERPVLPRGRGGYLQQFKEHKDHTYGWSLGKVWSPLAPKGHPVAISFRTAKQAICFKLWWE